MNRNDVLEFLRTQRLAVQASVSPDLHAQAAAIGFAIDEDFSIVFDTLTSTRKAQNLRRNPHVALVIGGLREGDERSVQYEGIASFPDGEELARAQTTYFAAFPDGRERLAWADICYVRVRPRWIRYSDFNNDPPIVAEFSF